MTECGGYYGAVMELLWQVLGDFDPSGRVTSPLAAWFLIGAIAVGLLFWYLVRNWRVEAAALSGEGAAHHQTNRNEAAIALSDRAVVPNPLSFEALKDRGLHYSQIGEYDLAMQDFHMLVLRAPESGDAYFHRGCIWEKLGLIGLAFSDYRSALRFNPSHDAARGSLANQMRNSAGDRPKNIFCLAELFSARVPTVDQSRSPETGGTSPS